MGLSGVLMKKGVSPIVAVVLLIAIAVIAAVGLYFWVSSLTGQQPEPTKPKTITATVVGLCNTSVLNASAITKVMLSNSGPPGKDVNTTHEGDSVALKTSGGGNVTCTTNGTLSSGETTDCDVTGIYKGVGTIAIYGSDTSSAYITC